MNHRNEATENLRSSALMASTSFAGAWLLLISLALACSVEQEPSTVSSASAAHSGESGHVMIGAGHDRGAGPQIVSLRLEPKRPTPDQEVRAVVSLANSDAAVVDLNYTWSLAGKTVRGRTAALRFPASRKGELIEVTVTATDDQGRVGRASASERVGNRPPVLIRVELSPQGIRPGHPIEAHVVTRDPDGDSQRILYDWRVNGSKVGERSSSLKTRGLRRGDEVQLRVSVDDGDDHSEVFLSDVVRIPNSPPQIVSEAVNDSSNGSFSYQVEARDPDHDRGLIYSLIRAPEGMTISRRGGRLSWSPRPDQNGVHPVIIRVEDRYGDASEQSFELTIAEESTPQDMASARS